MNKYGGVDLKEILIEFAINYCGENNSTASLAAKEFLKRRAEFQSKPPVSLHSKASEESKEEGAVGFAEWIMEITSEALNETPMWWYRGKGKYLTSQELYTEYLKQRQ